MRRKIPSLQALICFESAAKHLSYSHAAQQLCISQSAVSRQIQQLEAFLSLALFERSKYGVRLTQAGQDYYQSIKAHLNGLEQSSLDLISHKGLGGRLRLGVVPTFATRWLVPRLADFHAQHPEISIHLETRTQPFLFTEHHYDAAIFAGTAEQIDNWPGIQATYLMPETLIAVCSAALLRQHFPNRPSEPADALLSMAQLAQLPLLQQSTRPHIWADFFAAAGFSHPQPQEGTSYELFSMLALAASHHQGVALIPKMLIEKELQSAELVIASAQRLTGKRAYYFIYPSQTRQHLASKFEHWLLQQIHSQGTDTQPD